MYTAGTEVSETLLAIKISFSTARMGMGCLGERNLACDHGLEDLVRYPQWQGSSTLEINVKKNIQ